jgi:hypothetical protein
LRALRRSVKKREKRPRELIDLTRRDPVFWLWHPAAPLTR